ncbi:MAG: response regulator transcription factor [Anaerolineae bacterium]|nr:response regulator transcription factor [Candidatus Roseilinea sp.]MDW8449428.1 response regulator transcription factor [Anaerolineae bacterium]
MSPIRILIADDHPVVRDGLIAMLGTQPDFVVVAEASDGREMVVRAVQHAPDVVLLDLEMPGLDGVEALRQLRAQLPDARVLVFTAFDTDARIVGAIQAGAQGYLLKGAPREQLFDAIRAVARGESLLQPAVQSRLMRHLREARDRTPVEPLTPREVQVLRLMAEGKTNKEIAAQLAITERTVKFHVGAILGKLGAGNRTEAVRLAAQRGWVTL